MGDDLDTWIEGAELFIKIRGADKINLGAWRDGETGEQALAIAMVSAAATYIAVDQDSHGRPYVIFKK